ncbi:MAG: hypothetical protein U0841_04650 [Chloroflexia bacterium]
MPILGPRLWAAREGGEGDWAMMEGTGAGWAAVIVNYKFGQ